MQGQEERLADLWGARMTLAGLSEAKLLELDTELDSMRHLLWNAESAEDLESVADDLQAAAKLVGRLWHELPEDAPPLPFDISRYRSTGVDVATAYAAHFPSGTIVIGGGPGFEPEVTIGAEPVPSTPVSDGPPPPTLPPSPPGPVLSEAATDRRAERAWLVQLVIVVITALVVLGAGLGALYDLRVDKLQIDIGEVRQDRVLARLAGDDREHHELEAVHQAGGEECSIHRDTPVGAQGDGGLLLQARDFLERVAGDELGVHPIQRFLQRLGDHELPGCVQRRVARVVVGRGEALHQAVGVGAENEGLVLVAVDTGALVAQLGAVLAPVPHRSGAEAVDGGEEVDCVRRA